MENNIDNHTVFVRCGNATVAQIREAFSSAVFKYSVENDPLFSNMLKVNIVENRAGESMGMAFVFFTNPEAYHMVLGKNPDGTDRKDYIDDPNWVKKSDEVCPKILGRLEPLVVVPPYKLTDEQIEDRKAKGQYVEESGLAYFTVTEAQVKDVDPKYMSNVLKCEDVPAWVTKEELKSKFRNYASDSTTTHDRYVRGEKIVDTYPFVNINSNNIAFIIFDPRTRDAQFALLMMMKTKLKHNDKEYTLVFKHSYKTDRDASVEESSRPKAIRKQPEQRQIPQKREEKPRHKPVSRYAVLPLQ